jgi:hypothetical protein
VTSGAVTYRAVAHAFRLTADDPAVAGWLAELFAGLAVPDLVPDPPGGPVVT